MPSPLIWVSRDLVNLLFLIKGVCVVCVSLSVVSDSLRPHGLKPTRLLCAWDFPDKDTGVGCHFLLQGIFLIQGSNPGLLHCRQILYQPSYNGSPKGDTLTNASCPYKCKCFFPEGNLLFFCSLFCVWFLKSNQFKIILKPKRHILGWHSLSINNEIERKV